MSDYQLIVIGAGPGGYTAASCAPPSWDCIPPSWSAGRWAHLLNRGCIPIKTLLHASQVYYDAENGAVVAFTAAF